MKLGRAATLGILFAVLLTGCPQMDDLTVEQLAAVAERRGAGAGDGELEFGVRPTTRPATREAGLPKIDPKKVADEPRPVVALTLSDCLLRAMASSLAIGIEAFNPAIRAQDIIAAEAVFDAVFFMEGDLGEQNERTFSPFEGTGELRGSQSTAKAGLRQRLPIGLNLEAYYRTTRTTTSSIFAGLSPEWESDLVVVATLNLARGAGVEVNQAQIEISKRAREISDEAFRDQVMITLNEVTVAYTRLIQARRTHGILRELVAATQETHSTVSKRHDSDPVSVKNAKASLDQRKVLLVRAKSAIESAEDVLLNLLNDADLPLGRTFGILPTDDLTAERFTPDRTNAVKTAMAERSELRQAALAVHSARTALLAADNDRLPVADLALMWSQRGTDGTFDDSGDALFSDSLYDWLLSLKIEMPLGNRERDARHRQRRLELAQATKALRKIRADVILQVNEAVRELETGYEEIQRQIVATKSAREALDVIVRRMTKSPLANRSAPWMDVRLNAEAQWIQARRNELDAITAYNIAIANFLRVTGTILERNNVRLRPARAE